MSQTHVRPAIVYDGDCPFCRRQIDRLRRWDRTGQFECIPRQTANLETRFPALAGSDFNAGMRCILPTGAVYVGADAVHQILLRLPGWRAVAWLYHLPVLHGLSRLAYRWVAAHRMSLAAGCPKGACDREPGEHASTAKRSAPQGPVSKAISPSGPKAAELHD